MSYSAVKLAVVVLNIVGPAGNSTLGVPSVGEQEQDYQSVAGTINGNGGVDCRKLSLSFFPANPIDQSNLHQVCLDVSQAGVFAVMDTGAYTEFPTLAECYPQNHLPYLTGTNFPRAEQQAFYPYFFSTSSTMEVVYRNAISGLQSRGFFNPAHGFKKLGFVYRSCVPAVIQEIDQWFRQAGVPASQISSFDLGCPLGFASPGSIEQAVLKFQQAGVTSVFPVEMASDFSNFTTISDQQGFHPDYGIPDDGIVETSYASGHADYKNIVGATAVMAQANGEERTPGMAPGAGTAACNAIFHAVGRPPVYDQPDGFGGVACDQVWMMAAALVHAPRLQRTALAAGLQAAGSVTFSYPFGPNDFRAPGTTTGQEFWRVDQFFASCNCWRVVDRTWHASA